MKKVYVLALTVLVGVALPGAQGKRFITEKDLFKFTWIADPQISPDGSRVAFVRVTVNEKENRYETSLFAVPAAGGEAPRRLTSGLRDTAPRWSSDGKRLAFVRSVDKDGKPQPAQLYLLQMDGGEARPLTEGTSSASNPVWSPDGMRIAFNRSTGPGDAKAPADAKPAEHKSDVEVVTRAVYRANGNPGYVDTEHHSHIFTVAVPAADSVEHRNALAAATPPKQVTDGEFSEGGMQWSPDGSTIYFTSIRVAEPYFEEREPELYAVPAAGGTMTKVAAIEGGIGNISVSPDGQRIAFVGSLRGTPIRSYSQPDLWVVESAAGRATPRNLTARYDYDIGGGIGGDQAAPRGGGRRPIVWSKDGGSLIVVSAEKGNSNLKRVTLATGAIEPLTDGAHDVAAYSATADAGRIAAVLSTQTNIGDIDVINASRSDGARASQASVLEITHVNADLFKDIQQSEPEEIWYKSFDGKNIQGWILKPPDFDASKKYPLILEIHGGPHGAYGNVYTHEFQWMAA
ncbi:MAG: prolyl oligopeptidase family serine peptidase, partial [Vicinamibacterales bacterium]